MIKCKWLISCLFIYTTSFASWEEITSAVEGTIIQSKLKDSLITQIGLNPTKSLDMVIKKKMSLRLLLTNESDGQCSLFTKSSVINSQPVKSGVSKISYFLEPGKYTFKITTNSSIRFFRYKRTKMDLMMPEGGGYPEYLTHNNKQYQYDLISDTITPIYKIQGPVNLKVFTRIFMKDDSYKQSFNLLIKDNRQQQIVSRKSKVKRTQMTKVASDTSKVISEAYVTSISIPKGNHKYQFTLKDSKGLVKVYTEKVTATIKNPKTIRKVFGTFKVK